MNVTLPDYDEDGDDGDDDDYNIGMIKIMMIPIGVMCV